MTGLASGQCVVTHSHSSEHSRARLHSTDRARRPSSRRRRLARCAVCMLHHLAGARTRRDAAVALHSNSPLVAGWNAAVDVPFVHAAPPPPPPRPPIRTPDGRIARSHRGDISSRRSGQETKLGIKREGSETLLARFCGGAPPPHVRVRHLHTPVRSPCMHMHARCAARPACSPGRGVDALRARRRPARRSTT